jgi:hypothetical protein
MPSKRPLRHLPDAPLRPLGGLERRKARNQLRTAITSPLRKLIEEDANASEALAAASRRREQDRSDQPTQKPEWPTVKIVERPSQEADAGDFQQLFLPFAFHWKWHDPQLAPPVVSNVDRTTGRIELDTFANDDRGWATAHAGFGVVLPRSGQSALQSDDRIGEKLTDTMSTPTGPPARPWPRAARR